MMNYDLLYMPGLAEKEKRELVPQETFLLGYRGSIAHGMYVPNTDPHSIDDKDVMGVCFANPNVYLGLGHFEQIERQVMGWDSVVYEFRKFVRLLINNNPNVLSLLWIEPSLYLYKETAGYKLVANRRLFLSKRIHASFTGYAYGQLKRMENAACRGYMGEKRKALVAKFGYDTKNAAHCIRLLRMGIECLKTGELNVWRSDAQDLLEIKLGKWDLEHVKLTAAYLFKIADEVLPDSPLPDEPRLEEIESFTMGMLSCYLKSKGY